MTVNVRNQEGVVYQGVVMGKVSDRINEKSKVAVTHADSAISEVHDVVKTVVPHAIAVGVAAVVVGAAVKKLIEKKK